MLPSKWENSSRCSTKLTHVYKTLPLALDCGQSKYSLWIFTIYIFSILGVAFAIPFLWCFQKLQLLGIKKFWNNFCCIELLFLWVEKACLRLFKSYFKLIILIFLSLMVSFLVDMFKWKALLIPKKNISIGIWDTF